MADLHQHTDDDSSDDDFEQEFNDATFEDDSEISDSGEDDVSSFNSDDDDSDDDSDKEDVDDIEEDIVEDDYQGVDNVSREDTAGYWDKMVSQPPITSAEVSNLLQIRTQILINGTSPIDPESPMEIKPEVVAAIEILHAVFGDKDQMVPLVLRRRYPKKSILMRWEDVTIKGSQMKKLLRKIEDEVERILFTNFSLPAQREKANGYLKEKLKYFRKKKSDMLAF